MEHNDLIATPEMNRSDGRRAFLKIIPWLCERGWKQWVSADGCVSWDEI